MFFRHLLYAVAAVLCIALAGPVEVEAAQRHKAQYSKRQGSSRAEKRRSGSRQSGRQSSGRSLQKPSPRVLRQNTVSEPQNGKATTRTQQDKGFSQNMANEPGFLSDMGRVSKRGLAIVAPAGGIPSSEIQNIQSLVQGFHASLPGNALAPGRVPYTANTDAARLDVLTKALTDPRSGIVWSLRGGYGSGRLLDDLSKVSKPARPKVFIGYSDMTFLHLFLQKWGWQTVHASMLWELTVPEKDPDNFRKLAALLAGRQKELRYDGLTPFNALAKNQKQPIEGVITGGNLACLASAAGTPWALKSDGKILFLEDIQEPGYRLDRLFVQLQDSGALRGMKAVILGSFVQCKDDAGFALERFADECPVPVFKTELFGHGKMNYPLVFNAPSRLAPGQGGFTLTTNVEGLGAK